MQFSVPAILSEDQIETSAERMMDKADRQYTRGDITPAEYSEQVNKIKAWVAAEYRKRA